MYEVLPGASCRPETGHIVHPPGAYGRILPPGPLPGPNMAPASPVADLVYGLRRVDQGRLPLVKA